MGRGVNGPMYSHLVRTIAVPAVQHLYGNRAVWQDDPATIHRTAEALEACSEFTRRIPHDKQAPKMADVWPIESIWGILKQQVRDTKSKAELKRVITRCWREMKQDKGLIRRLVTSIPRRLQAVIDKEGSQVTKEDYQ